MNQNYKKFYRGCYLSTNGFIPTKPLNQTLFPGDFFQIKGGEMIVLGNIFKDRVVDSRDIEMNSNIQQFKAAWHFSEGVNKALARKSHDESVIERPFEFSTQKMTFGKPGSYFFHGNNPESTRIANWNQLQQQCIIKLTQTLFSFRELYVVTETATTSGWTLAISGIENAELEIATESESFDLVDIFGLESAKTIQSKGIEYYHRQSTRKPSFFKAKKLVVQDELIDTFMSQLIQTRAQHNEWASTFFKYDPSEGDDTGGYVPSAAQASFMDMLKANELNPNTALLYFKWADASLDDVEKLFLSYDN